MKKGDLDRHMAESLTHARAAGAPLDLLDDLRRTYDTRGRAGIVEFALRANANGPPMQLALLHGEAGNLDEAFAHLDAAIASRDPALVHVAVAPQWDCLRGDARFHERLEDVGLDAAADRCQRYLQQRSARPRQ